MQEIFDTDELLKLKQQGNPESGRNTAKIRKVRFKSYEPDQPLLLPPTFDELIPQKHIVRVINETLDKINMQPIIDTYKGGGTSSYNPLMLLKVLIFAYSQCIYSSRKIAKALRENLSFMWLSGGNKPNFRTINDFRLRLDTVLETIFAYVLKFLHEEGYISLENYFLDGTKLEANANKYTFVWRKSTERYKNNLEEKVKKLFREINLCNAIEDEKYRGKDLLEMGEDTEITSEKLKAAVDQIDQKIAESEDKKKLQKAKKLIEKDYLPRLKKYETQLQILNDRNSYSKTDTDATHMMNGQLKASYNIQIGTEHQFVIGYSIHQKAVDTSVMIPHLKKLKYYLSLLPKNIITDAGYGSEENYNHLKQEERTGYVPYNTFHREQKKKFKDQIYKVENLVYDEKNDIYHCPGWETLKPISTQKYITTNGYETKRKIYQCTHCDGCCYRSACHRSQHNRKIQVSPNLVKFKQTAKELLLSELGIELRKKRSIEVESVFGHIKQSRNFKRFMLRGLKKVTIEWGLLSLANNMIKKFNIDNHLLQGC